VRSRLHNPPAAGLSSIRLLNGFEAAVDGRIIDLAVTTQRLLALLALREQPQPRTAVSGTLWIDRSEDRAAASLRTALWKLGPTGHRLITMRGNTLAVADDVSVDFRLVVSQARELIRREMEPATHTGTAQAVDTFVGDLLPDWDEDWILFERERLRQLRMHAIEALSRRFIAAGRYAEAVDAGLAAVAADGLRESAHRVLIEAFLGEGNIADARRQFNHFRAVLWETLRLRPSPSLAGLVGA
jgi:DNA-binding SARP family transcriptional activator